MRSGQLKAASNGDKFNLGGRRAWAQFAAVFAFVAALAALMYRRPQASEWLQVRGTVQDTRIIPDQGMETNWGGELTWEAEYRVAYSVAGREYLLWTSSGIKGESKAGVRLALPQMPPSCWVRYERTRPEKAAANCR